MDQNQVAEDISLESNQNLDASQSKEPEKTFTRDQVAKMMNAERNKIAENARLQAEEKYKNDLAALQDKQSQRNDSVSKDLDANAIYQQVQERFNSEMKDQQMRQHMSQAADNYLQKVASGKTAYEDFDDVTKDFDPTAFPQLTYMLSGMENGGDVLYDLAKNPSKLAGLDRLAEKNWKLAHSELLKLSKSISDNKQALSDAKDQNVSEPLDRLNPSRVSGSNGKMGIRDLRNQPWLRG